MRVSHPVWWRGRLIVAKDDEAWYPIAVGWRHRVDDPDNPDVSIWPKHDRFVVAVEESLATIAERYHISSQELVLRNKGRYKGLAQGSRLIEVSVLARSRAVGGERTPYGTSLVQSTSTLATLRHQLPVTRPCRRGHQGLSVQTSREA